MDIVEEGDEQKERNLDELYGKCVLFQFLFLLFIFVAVILLTFFLQVCKNIIN
jgi:hypothetical protein